GFIGANLAERHHRLALERAGVEAVYVAAGYRLAADAARAGIDRQRGAVGIVGVAADHRGVGGFRNVERGREAVPLRLAVGDVDGPGDVGVVGGELGHHLAGAVIAVDAEARGLAFDGALRIAVIVGGLRLRRGDFGADEIPGQAVADAGDADGRMDGSAHDGAVGRHGKPLAEWRYGRAFGRERVAVPCATLGRGRPAIQGPSPLFHGGVSAVAHGSLSGHDGRMSRNGNGNGSGKAAARLPLDEPVMRPTFRRERSALKRGVWPVAGCDEAGRGPLAGPVVAAAVILNPDDVPRGLDDSKRLTAERREVLYERICARAQVAVAMAPPWRIDRDNILRASLWALARAVAALPVKPCLVFVDGRDRIAAGCDCEAVIGGDGLVASIAAASIVAKVTRDRLMARLGAAHPGYGFE